jgi:hypothetical protein
MGRNHLNKVFTGDIALYADAKRFQPEKINEYLAQRIQGNQATSQNT